MNSDNKKYNSDTGSKKMSKSNDINELNKLENKDTSQLNKKNLDDGTDNEEKNNLKNILLQSILREKLECDMYEIPLNLFKRIKIDKYGDCLYSCISYYLYETQENHLKIRNEVYQYLLNNKETYYQYFIPDNDGEEIPGNIDELIVNYVNVNNKEGEYGGDIELSILAHMLKINIIILINGYKGYNLFNQYEYNDKNKLVENVIFLYFENNNHFDYLNINEENENYTTKNEFLIFIKNSIEKNKNILSNIRKKIIQ